MAPVLKTGVVMSHQEFESLHFRQNLHNMTLKKILPCILFQGHFSVKKIKLEILAESKRQIDRKIENYLLRQWDKTLQEARIKGVKAWDSVIYRFESFSVADGNVVLRLSTVPFSIMRSARYYVLELKKLGKTYFPHGVFVSLVIKTKDGYYIRVKISSQTLNAGIYDLVGGVASKSEVALHNAQDLFQMSFNEMEEELGVYQNKVADIFLLGAVASSSLNVSLVFQVDLSITKEEVTACFFEKNDGEVESIDFLRVDEFKSALVEMGGYKAKIFDLVS